MRVLLPSRSCAIIRSRLGCSPARARRRIASRRRPRARRGDRVGGPAGRRARGAAASPGARCTVVPQRRRRASVARRCAHARSVRGALAIVGASSSPALHLVFGAIVRISGSGMGCGDHWPKCYGYWFPPLDRPDLIIEVIASVPRVDPAARAHRARSSPRGVARREPGVGGRGGVLRTALGLAVALGVRRPRCSARITVKLGNAPLATLAHWTVAMTCSPRWSTTADSRRRARWRRRARSAAASATRGAAAFAAADAGAARRRAWADSRPSIPGAAVACQTFPLCGRNPDVDQRAQCMCSSRIASLAVLLVLHLFGLVIMRSQARRRSAVVRARRGDRVRARRRCSCSSRRR